MTYAWKDFHKLSEDLRTNTVDLGDILLEARQRSSISRAYYSSYNIVLRHASSLGYSFPYLKHRVTGKPLTGTHADLIQYCKDNTDATINNIGNDLESCKNFRVIADYEDEFPNLNKKNKLVLKKVKRILDVLIT